jgi:hypothetical protein
MLSAVKVLATRDSVLGTRYSQLAYNCLVPETKPFRLTESVKAAG